MATRQEITDLMKPLRRNFTRFLNQIEKTERMELLEDYARELQDLPVEALAVAIKSLLNENREWYAMPSIGNIRGRANQFLLPPQTSPDTAWQQCLAGTVPPDSVAARVFSNLGFNRHDLGRLSHETVNVMQSNFIRSYRDASAIEQRRAAMPPACRAALPSPPSLGGIRQVNRSAEKLLKQREQSIRSPSEDEQEHGFVSQEEAATELARIYAALKETQRKRMEEDERQATVAATRRRMELQRQVKQLKKAS